MGILLDVSMTFIYSMHCSNFNHATVLPENSHLEIEINGEFNKLVLERILHCIRSTFYNIAIFYLMPCE